jgi:hypothetical protein
MASIGALVGRDETGRYEEATQLGILPGYGEFQVVFMSLIPRDHPAEASHISGQMSNKAMLTKVLWQILASRVLEVQRLIKTRRRWWNVLWRDISTQSRAQPFIFYGALFALFFGICTIIQTVVAVMTFIQPNSYSCTCSINKP